MSIFRRALRFALYLFAGLAMLVTVAIAWMLYDGVRTRDKAQAFCASVKVGDDPEQVLLRARNTDAHRSSLVWRGIQDQDGPKVLELDFVGGIPPSVHVCRLDATRSITRAEYFHRH